MKNLLYATLLFSAAQSFSFDTDRVEEAIENSSLSVVKSQCNKIDRDDTITLQARKKLYRNLHGLASDTTVLRAETISIFGNWRDTAKIAGGAATAGAGLLMILAGALGVGDNDEEIYERGRVVQRRASGPNIAPIVTGTLLEVVSAYFLYKGITCSTQKAAVDSAKTVEKFLKGKLNALESDSE